MLDHSAVNPLDDGAVLAWYKAAIGRRVHRQEKQTSTACACSARH